MSAPSTATWIVAGVVAGALAVVVIVALVVRAVVVERTKRHLWNTAFRDTRPGERAELITAMSELQQFKAGRAPDAAVPVVRRRGRFG